LCRRIGENEIRPQQQHQRGSKPYSFHVLMVERIGKGKTSTPYEFGVKASIITTNRRVFISGVRSFLGEIDQLVFDFKGAQHLESVWRCQP
jgi:hypothetical protein